MTRNPQYYKPWNLRPAEETAIKDQIRNAEDTIDRELEGFEQRRQRQKSASKTVEEQQAVNVESQNGNGTVGSMNTKQTSDDPIQASTNKMSDVPAPDPEEVLPSVVKEEDDGGEVMLEGDEDTVIY